MKSEEVTLAAFHGLKHKYKGMSVDKTGKFDFVFTQINTTFILHSSMFCRCQRRHSPRQGDRDVHPRVHGQEAAEVRGDRGQVPAVLHQAQDWPSHQQGRGSFRGK